MKTPPAIELELRSVSASEVDLPTWHPGCPEDVLVGLALEVGVKGETAGTNLFYVTLATPEALRHRRQGWILAENRTLVVDSYDYEKLLTGIEAILAKCGRPTWEESCAALQRYFQWEYEDYQADS